MGLFNFFHGPSYTKVALSQIESDKSAFDGLKVEYVGTYESGFEVSTLDGKIWLQSTKDTNWVPDHNAFSWVNAGHYRARVKVFGTLMTKEIASAYGHLGGYSYQIVADKVELLEKLPS